MGRRKAHASVGACIMSLERVDRSLSSATTEAHYEAIAVEIIAVAEELYRAVGMVRKGDI